MNYEEQIEEVPFTPQMEASLRQLVLNRASEQLKELAAAVDDEGAFTHLPHAAAAAFHLGQYADAKQFADRVLELAPSFRNDWNYGNAIHLGHTVLGLLAVDAEDYSLAIQELHMSGETPGSPQLNSFGPTMQLAKTLLRAGHVEPVLAYLKQCRVFWSLGGTWLTLWERKIKEGRVPNFFQHSHA